MKKLILSVLTIMFISQFSNAQNNYDTFSMNREKIYKLELESLPKSALAEVKKNHRKAKSTNNAPQIVKTLLYKSKFALTLEENAQLKVINDLKSEISENSFPTTNILESVLAGIYWQYFQQNRWRFYNRTNTSEKIDDIDFRTWDLQTIFEETHLLFQNSLANSLELQQINLKVFDAVLNLQGGSKNYRPTLYDFIAHRAIDFYKNDEQNLSRPSYKFEIDNTDLLGTNKQFIAVTISSKDNLSQHLQALKLYRNLTLFHLKDANPVALIALTLERLNFVKENAVFKNKEEVYLNTLQVLKETYKTHEVSTEIDFQIAKLYNEQVNQYQPKINVTNRFNRKKALAICKLAIEKFPNSKGAQKCEILKSQILQKNISIISENHLPIQTVSRGSTWK